MNLKAEMDATLLGPIEGAYCTKAIISPVL